MCLFTLITIGEMAVLAARSTVLHDIPSNEIHAGSPAICIKCRFEENEKEEMLKEVTEKSTTKVHKYCFDLKLYRFNYMNLT